MSEKELMKLLKKAKEAHQSFRFHIYGTIDVNMPDEYSNVNDVLENLQGYGEGKVIYVEKLPEKVK